MLLAIRSSPAECILALIAACIFDSSSWAGGLRGSIAMPTLDASASLREQVRTLVSNPAQADLS